MVSLRYRLLPLRWRAPFANAYVSQETFATVIVTVSSSAAEGVEGIGEAAPSFLWHETVDTVQATYLDVIRSGALSDLVPDEPGSWAGVLDSLVGQPAARAGLEMALLDLAAKLRQTPLWRWWGLEQNKPLHTFFTIPMANGVELTEWLAHVVYSGYDAIKVKVGGRTAEEPQDAIRRLERIRRAAPTAAVRVDANASWDLQQALDMARVMTSIGAEAIEEPLLATAPDKDYARFREAVAIPVLGDEQCTGPTELSRRAHHYDGVVIKQANWGGLTRARQGISLARRHGLSVTLGCNAETNVGMSAAATIAPLADHLDLDSSLLLLDDPFSGVDFASGTGHLSQDFGIGAVPRNIADD